MPYLIKKVKDGFSVLNKDTGKVYSKHTTKSNARKQVKLLIAIEHGFKPNKKWV